MKKGFLASVALAGLILGVTAVSSQPPGRDGERGPGDRKGGPPPGGPPRFELGRVLPPPLVEELELTDQQRAEIARLEKEVKTRLTKILTPEQRKKAEAFRPRPPRGPGGPGGPGGPPRDRPDRPRRGPDGDRPGRPERPEGPDRDEANNGAAIQWFATWESGLREAQRSGRPILLVSAAPHCAGVSGIW